MDYHTDHVRLTRMFMPSLDHGSLHLVAVYGLASCLTVMLCGAWLRALVDRTSRKRMVNCSTKFCGGPYMRAGGFLL